MAIPEQQLDSWASQGAIATSRDTYASIKAVLEDEDAPYANRAPKVFLQGSYGNDTNVFAESDVDVVIRMDSIFYYDISALSAEDQAEYLRTHPAAEYQLANFKAEVTEWLQQNYGVDAQLSNKTVKVAARGSRRKADVLISAMHRRYFYQGFMGQQSVEGVKFVTQSGQWIENFPILHSHNLTAQHQAVRQWLKPTIRIFKNMRNKMVADGIIAEGVAPSYFIEGLLANVPNEQFGPNYQSTVVNSLNWLRQADRDSFLCINGQHQLLGNNSPTSWPAANCTTFLNGVATLWNDWR